MSRSLARYRVLMAVLLVGAGGLALVPGQAGGKVWDKEITNSIGMKLVRIPKGTFKMGSDKAPNQKPVHEVEISKEFWMGIHEVTQGQYQKVMKENPSYFSKKGSGKDKVKDFDSTDNFPVESITWYDAVKFCKTLSAMAKEQAANREYRLPTEAEWEYACRAGTKTDFHFGDSLSSKQANFNGNKPYGGADKGPYLKRTTPVGSYEKNAFGLFDMHGNVWEWCQDWYAKDYYAKSDKKDPKGPIIGRSRAARGGSWNFIAINCRAAFRDYNSPGKRYLYFGFRVVCVRTRAPSPAGAEADNKEKGAAGDDADSGKDDKAGKDDKTSKKAKAAKPAKDKAKTSN